MLDPSFTPVNRFQLLMTGQSLVDCFRVLSSSFNSPVPGMCIYPIISPFAINVLVPDLPGTY